VNEYGIDCNVEKPNGYSMIMLYYVRPDQLYNTLSSFRYWYADRENYEVVIIEDPYSYANPEWRQELRDVLALFPEIDVNLLQAEKEGISSMHNQGAREAKYNFILFNGPEILHYRNALDRFDEYLQVHETHYAVGSCWLSTFPGRIEEVYPPGLEVQGFKFNSWYQHGRVNNRRLHFCSAMSKQIFERIGGFCTEFDEGVAFEDDDFREVVLSYGLEIIPLDSVEVVHQRHPAVNKPHKGNGWSSNRDTFSRRQNERAGAANNE
jgi:hypothetical protein